MHLIVVFAVCLLLWHLSPKGFALMVGSWVGFAGGGFCWGIAAMLVPALITLHVFVGFLVVGTVAGVVVAARG
jgi:hypothetical protein